jgi:hypothetical protein
MQSDRAHQDTLLLNQTAPAGIHDNGLNRQDQCPSLKKRALLFFADSSGLRRRKKLLVSGGPDIEYGSQKSDYHYYGYNG